eukprot:scaffold34809_cov69-Phaeocystis_antarctica.AAC.4
MTTERTGVARVRGCSSRARRELRLREGGCERRLGSQAGPGRRTRATNQKKRNMPRRKKSVRAHWQTDRVASCCSSRLAAWCTSWRFRIHERAFGSAATIRCAVDVSRRGVRPRKRCSSANTCVGFATRSSYQRKKTGVRRACASQTARLNRAASSDACITRNTYGTSIRTPWRWTRRRQARSATVTAFDTPQRECKAS